MIGMKFYLHRVEKFWGRMQHVSEADVYCEIITIMYTFMCYFSKLEHTARYKAKNQSTVKTNFCMHMHAHTHTVSRIV